MQQDLLGFASAKLTELKKLEQTWGSKKTKENLMKYSLRNERFCQTSFTNPSD